MNNVIIANLLTKEEYTVFSIVFQMGVSAFFEDLDFMCETIIDKDFCKLVESYKNDRTEIVQRLSEKFEIDI